jgi:hypothetical protein
MLSRFYTQSDLSLLFILSLCLLLPTSFLSAKSDDSGYLFLGAKEERRVKKFKDGNTLTAYHQFGTVASNEETSPWNRASFFAQSSILTNSDNVLITEVALCETIDNDGDITWSTFWKGKDGTSEISLKAGTGKWKGIAGSGTSAIDKSERIDGSSQPEFVIDWRIANLPPTAGRSKPEDYTFHDKGLSFHGPHIYDFSKTLDNGVTLLVSSQSGVLLSEDEKAISPRNFATCYDRSRHPRR